MNESTRCFTSGFDDEYASKLSLFSIICVFV